MSRGVIRNSHDILAAIEAAARGEVGGQRKAKIPQPVRSHKHNLAAEREYLPLQVPDPAGGGVLRRGEFFASYGSGHHALTYFRGNENIPSVMDPILAAMRELDVIKALQEPGTKDSTHGDELGLHWKLTLNHYKKRVAGDDGAALSEAGGALFPWHTDLAANGEITAISTLLAPAMLEFAPHADLGAAETPTRITAMPGSLVLLSGPARWDWVHRAVPHPDAAGKERISLVLGCASRPY